MKINLFVNYYKTKTPERQKEIDFCLKKNSENNFIDRVIIFSDFGFSGFVGLDLDLGEQLRCVHNDRPTYQAFFDTAKDYPDDINIIANSDIYFDETIELVKQMGDNDFYALTRWEYNNGDITDFNRMHGAPPEWSQDAWIWKGVNRATGLSEVVATNLQTNRDEKIPYTTGIPGCENHLAWLMQKRYGYNVSNPSKIIKAIHVHQEQSRPNYTHRVKGCEQCGTWGWLLKVPQS